MTLSSSSTVHASTSRMLAQTPTASYHPGAHPHQSLRPPSFFRGVSMPGILVTAAGPSSCYAMTKYCTPAEKRLLLCLRLHALDNVTSHTPQVRHDRNCSKVVLNDKAFHLVREQLQRVFVWIRGAFLTERYCVLQVTVLASNNMRK